MTEIVVLGAGMQGRAAVYDLCRQEGVTRVTVIDNQAEQLARLATELPHAKLATVEADVQALTPDHQALQAAAIVLNLLPKAFEEPVFELALRSGKSYVSTNYGHRLRERSTEAERAGVLVLPEVGLDPGIDLVLCGLLLDGMSTVRRLDSYGTGLPTPAFRNNPLEYKVTWTFAGVLDAYRRDGVLVQRGRRVEVPAARQFRIAAHTVAVKELGELEAYVNGDAWGFVEQLGLSGKVREAGRYSLRYPGHSAFWEKASHLGLLDTEPRLDLGGLSPRECLRRVIEPKLQLGTAEKDAVYIRVLVEGQTAGKSVRRVGEVYDERDLGTGFTAMSRTVGFTAASAVEMILAGEISGTGVLSPLRDLPAKRLLERLEQRGIRTRITETRR